jgi:hypothetical protein
LLRLDIFTHDVAITGRDLLRDQAEPCGEVRPLSEGAPVPIAATMALEMIGPMAGTLISRSHPAFGALASLSLAGH